MSHKDLGKEKMNFQLSPQSYLCHLSTVPSYHTVEDFKLSVDGGGELDSNEKRLCTGSFSTVSLFKAPQNLLLTILLQTDELTQPVVRY